MRDEIPERIRQRIDERMQQQQYQQPNMSGFQQPQNQQYNHQSNHQSNHQTAPINYSHNIKGPISKTIHDFFLAADIVLVLFILLVIYLFVTSA